MIQVKNILIEGTNKKPIVLDVCYPEVNAKVPVVIFVHGFKGFKDWGHFNQLAKAISDSGFAFVKFNFSHNGTTPDHLFDFVDLEAFGNNNYLTELNELGMVLDWVMDNECLNGIIDTQKIYLIGHSRGGGICVLKTAEDKRVKKLVTWAAVSDIIGRVKADTIEKWKEKGVIYTLNSRTQQQMPMYYQLYETTQANKKRLNILQNAKTITVPALVIHGTNDQAVSKNDATELHKALPGSELLLVENGGHTFEVKHPFTEEEFPENAKIVIAKTIRFLLG